MCVCVCGCADVRGFVRLCVRMRLGLRVWARVRVRLCACVRAFGCGFARERVYVQTARQSAFIARVHSALAAVKVQARLFPASFVEFESEVNVKGLSRSRASASTPPHART